MAGSSGNPANQTILFSTSALSAVPMQSLFQGKVGLKALNRSGTVPVCEAEILTHAFPAGLSRRRRKASS
jgi:hypothetical protein